MLPRPLLQGPRLAYIIMKYVVTGRVRRMGGRRHHRIPPCLALCVAPSRPHLESQQPLALRSADRSPLPYWGKLVFAFFAFFVMGLHVALGLGMTLAVLRAFPELVQREVAVEERGRKKRH